MISKNAGNWRRCRKLSLWNCKNDISIPNPCPVVILYLLQNHPSVTLEFISDRMILFEKVVKVGTGSQSLWMACRPNLQYSPNPCTWSLSLSLPTSSLWWWRLTDTLSSFLTAVTFMNHPMLCNDGSSWIGCSRKSCWITSQVTVQVWGNLCDRRSHLDPPCEGTVVWWIKLKWRTDSFSFPWLPLHRELVFVCGGWSSPNS